MTKTGLSRRDFLQGTGTAVGVVAVGSGSMIVASDESWALSTTAIDADTAQSLLAMARHLYPHDFLGDVYYAEVVANLDESAADDSDLRATLTGGVRRMGVVREGDRTYDIPFHRQSSGLQLQAIKHAEEEDNAFFEAVRTATLNGLYGNQRVAAMFGFEGSSVEFGGYLNRGFNDIGWLPRS